MTWLGLLNFWYWNAAVCSSYMPTVPSTVPKDRTFFGAILAITTCGAFSEVS